MLQVLAAKAGSGLSTNVPNAHTAKLKRGRSPFSMTNRPKTTYNR